MRVSNLRQSVSREPEMEQYQAHLNILKLQQLRTASDNDLSELEVQIEDARRKHSLEGKRLDRVMDQGTRFGKSSKFMDPKSIEVSNSLISQGGSTHQSLNSITRKGKKVHIPARPKPDHPKQYLF